MTCNLSPEPLRTAVGPEPEHNGIELSPSYLTTAVLPNFRLVWIVPPESTPA